MMVIAIAEPEPAAIHFKLFPVITVLVALIATIYGFYCLAQQQSILTLLVVDHIPATQRGFIQVVR